MSCPQSRTLCTVWMVVAFQAYALTPWPAKASPLSAHQETVTQHIEPTTQIQNKTSIFQPTLPDQQSISQGLDNSNIVPLSGTINSRLINPRGLINSTTQGINDDGTGLRDLLAISEKQQQQLSRGSLENKSTDLNAFLQNKKRVLEGIVDNETEALNGSESIFDGVIDKGKNEVDLKEGFNDNKLITQSVSTKLSIVTTETVTLPRVVGNTTKKQLHKEIYLDVSTTASSNTSFLNSLNISATSSHKSVITNQIPVITSHTPVNSSQTPVNSSQTPVTSSQTPVTSSQTSATTSQTTSHVRLHSVLHKPTRKPIYIRGHKLHSRNSLDNPAAMIAEHGYPRHQVKHPPCWPDCWSDYHGNGTGNGTHWEYDESSAAEWVHNAKHSEAIDDPHEIKNFARVYGWIIGAAMLSVGSLISLTGGVLLCFCGHKIKKRREERRRKEKYGDYERVESVSSLVSSVHPADLTDEQMESVSMI